MSFFQGVNTQASADPLNATDIANLIGLLFDNPNGMVSPSLGLAGRLSKKRTLCYCIVVRQTTLH